MKRAIGPGQKVELSELYNQYGVKHGLTEGREFVEWLRNVKLKDTNKWKVVYNEDTGIQENISEQEVKDELVKEKPKATENVSPMVKTKLSVEDGLRILGFALAVGKASKEERTITISNLN